jgi:hypothetical protein
MIANLRYEKMQVTKSMNRGRTYVYKLSALHKKGAQSPGENKAYIHIDGGVIVKDEPTEPIVEMSVKRPRCRGLQPRVKQEQGILIDFPVMIL